MNRLSFLAGAKGRLIVATVLALCVVGTVVGMIIHVHNKRVNAGSAVVAGAPTIDNVPGLQTTSSEYTKDQNLQNQRAAELARENQTSAVPTITRPDFLGDLNQFAHSAEAGTHSDAAGGPHDCPLKNTVVMFRPNPASCLPKNLELARQAGVTAEELRCQGCSCPALKLAGYSIGDLKNTGFEADELKQCGFTLGQLVQAGYTATDLKMAGFDAAQLADEGFSAGQLATAGFSPASIRRAGYSADALQAAGIGTDNALNPNCDAAVLSRAHQNKVSAMVLHNQGCGLTALKAAGFTAAELKAAGFNATALHDAGYSAAALKAAGFSAEQLKVGGFNSSDLHDAGYSAAALRAAGLAADDLKEAGYSDAALQAAGFSPAEIKKADATFKICNVQALHKARDAGASAVELKNQGCGLAALKAGGFSAAELRAAGFSANDLKSAGFTPVALHDAGFSAAQLRAAGISAKALHDVGYSAAELKAAGFSAEALRAAGYTPNQLQTSGLTAAQLKAAGLTASQLRAAGFTAAQLKAAGLTAGELNSAGFSATELSAVGFDAQALRDAGFTAADLKTAGFSPLMLKQAGYTSGDLLRAGFTPGQSGYQSGSVPALSAQSLASQSELSAGPTVAPSSNNSNGLNIPSATDNSPEGRLEAITRQEQQDMNDQQRQQELEQEQGAMMQEAQHMMGEWSKSSSQEAKQAIEPVAPENAGNAKDNGSTDQNGGPVVKAGSIMFAVLDTSINTDENTPIMARIVTGSLQGSKLLGTFSRVDKKVLLKFDVLNAPAYPRSISINAVAIDPDTARTALAGQVDNHYLLRYGTLFASAFLSGFSNALTSASGNNQCSGSIICNVTHTQSPLNTGQQVMVGMGTVGNRYAAVMGSNFSKPPTVQIPGGTGFGLLIMNDVQLPLKQPDLNPSDESVATPVPAPADLTH